jgi:patatin-related protein
MATQSGLPILKEVRFAVVMYGGVSLAIYINGVAQELLKMVRATARKEDGTYLIPSPDPSTPELDKNNVLSGTEIVYRQIGKELNAKFVIDILSGTSAGGINAVYLAKALVNDQSLDPLKSMWVKEGDIALFVNDKQSTRGLPRNLARLLNQKPRTSLLNSQRMYYKLLEALDQMENQPSVPVSPYVDMLDLFVTATDLQGLYSAIRISQQNVYELRYRSVFHFEYSTKDIHDRSQADLRVQRNDFSRRFNPFLAFVARCTSSFPFAFEPMTLADIEDILNSSTFYSVYKYEPDKWKLFFEDYLRKEKVTPLAGEQKEAEIGKAIDRFAQRPFGDGGYLDNKPFSYATNAILSRQGMLPVDRKLFYIEPSPEHPEEDRLNRERPDAFANVFSALLALPRYETIREDLQLISEHNRVVRRLRGTTELAMKAIFENGKIQKFWHQSAQRKEAWEKKTLQEMIVKYGVGYGVYHQLRVTQVTHDLGTLVTQVLGSEEESDLWKQCRSVLKTWREENYAPNPGKGEGKATENEFLYKLDISWRIRRLRFLLYLLEHISKMISDENNDGSEMNKSKIILKEAVIAN